MDYKKLIEQLSKIGVLARGGGKCKCLYWEWRGPQKEKAL